MRYFNLQNIGFTLFYGIVVLHVWLRLYKKARPARLKPRGEVRDDRLIHKLVRSYLVLATGACLEGMFWKRPWNGMITATAAILYGVMVYVQWRAFQDLGESYSPDIEVRQNQMLVRTGLYAIVRHPLLSSLYIELLAVVLFFNAYIALLVSAVVFAHVIRERRHDEEIAMVEHFGAAYHRYSEDVGSLFPKLIHSHKELVS